MSPWTCPRCCRRYSLRTGADAAFTCITGGDARSADLDVTIAALLVAYGCNVGPTPVVASAGPLTRDRSAHVDRTYLRHAARRAADAAPISAQQSIGFAQARGGGLAAYTDGMRFMVPGPVRARAARPDVLRPPAIWLNMINAQAAGPGGRGAVGALRDSLSVLDDRHGGRRPEMTVNRHLVVFRHRVRPCSPLAGYTCAPQPAALSDRQDVADRRADCGPFRRRRPHGRIDLKRVGRTSCGSSARSTPARPRPRRDPDAVARRPPHPVDELPFGADGRPGLVPAGGRGFRTARCSSVKSNRLGPARVVARSPVVRVLLPLRSHRLAVTTHRHAPDVEAALAGRTAVVALASSI